MNDSKLSPPTETTFEQSASELSFGDLKLSLGVVGVESLGVIRVTGDDALSFLHNQLTQDFLNLAENEARFCSFCNAKGRIQASLIGIKSAPSEVLLICSKDLISQTVKRLSMFVLRAKVKITDSSPDFQLTGVIGKDAAISCGLPNSMLHTKPWSHLSESLNGETAHWISLYPALGEPRYLLISPPLAHPLSSTSNKIEESEWGFSQVMSGVCMIGLPTFESFIPQMINYESIGGVHFQKGCYPGQEVVARSQFRGTIKRRGFVIRSTSAIKDGDELFITSDTQQPCGQIVCAALHQGQYFGFASLLISAAEEIIKGSSAGASPTHIHTLSNLADSSIYILPLPYPLRDDI